LIDWKLLTFEQCSKEQLYELLELRNRVFIVEQGDPYPDLDGWDQKAIHILGYEDNVLVAYSRLLPPGLKRKEAVLGRVCSAKTHRNGGMGNKMLELRLDHLRKHYPGCTVYTSLQVYRQAKYESLGFKTTSEPYIDGKILHIDMMMQL
jgi:ElaA protein